MRTLLLKLAFHPAILPHILRWKNRRSARNTIELCRRIGRIPRQLIDVGAHESEWAAHLVNFWPHLNGNVHSFEPNADCHPIGFRHELALSDAPGRGSFSPNFRRMFIEDGDAFPVCRFDSLPFDFKWPCLLKVDCEHHTARAFRGFGDRLREVEVAVVEMWNHYDQKTVPGFNNQQLEIWQTAIAAGFTRSEVVNTEHRAGKVTVYDIAFYRE